MSVDIIDSLMLFQYIRRSSSSSSSSSSISSSIIIIISLVIVVVAVAVFVIVVDVVVVVVVMAGVVGYAHVFIECYCNYSYLVLATSQGLKILTS